MQIPVYYNPHTDTWTCTRVSVNAAGLENGFEKSMFFRFLKNLKKIQKSQM